jgi:glycosyltransferase involved in cell wall biosynthesis
VLLRGEPFTAIAADSRGDALNGGTPRVSVVVPNYNHAPYLEARFRSILDQSFRDYEIIFLDDASPDDSVQLVRREFGDRISTFEANASNSGNPFKQWNRGVQLARGEFVWVAESDDLCAPTFLERMMQALDRSPRIGLAYCQTLPIDEAAQVIDPAYYQWYVSDLDAARWRSDFVNDGREEVRWYLSRKNTITNVSGVVFRRSAYMAAGCAPEDMRMCGDWLMYCRVLHDSDVAYISEPLNFHRQHAAKHSHNAVLDLTYFKEFLQVQQYAADTFAFSRTERAAAFRRFLGEWDRLTVSNYGRIGLRKTLTLAQLTAARYGRADERMRIAGHFFLNATRSLAGAWKES